MHGCSQSTPKACTTYPDSHIGRGTHRETACMHIRTHTHGILWPTKTHTPLSPSVTLYLPVNRCCHQPMLLLGWWWVLAGSLLWSIHYSSWQKDTGMDSWWQRETISPTYREGVDEEENDTARKRRQWSVVWVMCSALWHKMWHFAKYCVLMIGCLVSVRGGVRNDSGKTR